MTTEDTWRLVNAVVALLLLGWLVVRGFREWPTYSAVRRDAWWLLASWLGTVGLGSLEVIFFPESHYRLILVSFALVISARVISKHVEVVEH